MNLKVPSISCPQNLFFLLSILMTSSHFWPSNWPFSNRYPHQNSLCILNPHPTYMPNKSQPPRFHYLNNIVDLYKSWITIYDHRILHYSYTSLLHTKCWLKTSRKKTTFRHRLRWGDKITIYLITLTCVNVKYTKTNSFLNGAIKLRVL
jgi:hypothetical protein